MAGHLDKVFDRVRAAVVRTLARHLITARELMKASTLQSTGLWVGFWLEPAAAAALAVPGGEPADALHVTLCYVPDVPPDDARVHAAMLALEVRARAAQAFTGAITGGGRFDGGAESDARDVLYAVPDLHGLVAFRQELVAALTAVGLPPSREHEFTPHVAIAYVERTSAQTIDPAPIPLHFDTLEVRVGGERIATIPLGLSSEALAKATKPDDPRVQAALDDLDLSDFDEAQDSLTALLAEVATQGMQQGALTVRALTPGAKDFALPNAAIVAWARDHAANLVGKRVLADGTVIDNPNAAYALTDATRELLRGTIAQAFEEAWAVPELRQHLAESYAFSADRAQLIARTEVSRALIQGNVTAWKASGVVEGKAWLLGSDHDRDDLCDENEAVGVIGMDEEFPSGDTEPPAHVNCLVSGTRVAAAGITGAMKRGYQGDVVIIRTAGNKELTITPNHPVLATTGWVAAGLVNEGNDLICHRWCDGRSALDTEHVQDVPTPIEQLTEAVLLAPSSMIHETPQRADEFHGDGTRGEIAVVGTYRQLRHAVQPSRLQQLYQKAFAWMLHAQATLARLGPSTTFLVGPALALADCPASNAQAANFLRMVASAEDTRLRAGSENASASQHSPRAARTDAELAGEIIRGGAGAVTTDKVIEVRRQPFHGHVYNLSTERRWYVAEGIVVHNCVCDVIPVLAGSGAEGG